MANRKITLPGAVGLAIKAIDQGDGTYAIATSPSHSGGAAFTPVTGNITAVANAVTADVSEIATAVISIQGTFTGLNVTFEGSNDGGAVWTQVQLARTNAGAIETLTGVIASPVAYMWEGSVNAFTHIRVRCTAIASGSAAVRINGSPVATEPAPVVTVAGTATVTGTVIATATTGTNYNLTSLATTNLVSVAAVATSLFELTYFNASAAIVYLKLYNKASAPVVASDVPLVVWSVAAGATLAQEFGRVGKRFSLGIGLALTGAAANTDATAIAAGTLLSLTRV